MSAQNDAMGPESVPQHDYFLFCHPKAGRPEAKKPKDQLENHGPAYPPKDQSRPPPANKAHLGDKAAHSYDGDDLCPKLLPSDQQEFRGCKTRDMDRNTKCWNKQVYLSLISGEEDAVACE